MDVFIKHVEQIAQENGASALDVVHKKINLAAPKLSWEHERYSIRRLPAFTISTFTSPSTRARETISDLLVENDGNDKKLCNNIKMIGEALARFIFEVPLNDHKSNVSTDFSLIENPSCDHTKSLRQFLAQESRAAPLLTAPTTSKNSKTEPNFVASLHNYISNWLPNSQIYTHTLEKKDSELVFYENLEVKLSTFV